MKTYKQQPSQPATERAQATRYGAPSQAGLFDSSPRVVAQAQALGAAFGPARIAIVDPSDRRGHPELVGDAPVQRQILIKSDDEGRSHEPARQLSASEALELLVKDHKVPRSERLKATLDQYETEHEEFANVDALAAAVKRATEDERHESKDPIVDPAPEEGLHEAVDEEQEVEEEDEESPIDFFHGTDLPTALKLVKSTTKITARGKGEFGGGFYMTHDLHQAAHIADYYCGKEKRSEMWAVVRFRIPVALVRQLVGERLDVDVDDAEEYYEQVKDKGNTVESSHAWTLGPIKDNATPYLQHLFAQGALGILNQEETTRSLVLKGTVGVDKKRYARHVKDYDTDNDKAFHRLLALEQPEQVSEEEPEGPDYEALGERVEQAKTAASTTTDSRRLKLAKAVIKELEEALEDAPEDERLLAWVAELQEL